MRQMRTKISLFIITMFLLSCDNKTTEVASKQESLPIAGTWQFVSGTTVNHNTNDTSFVDFRVKKSGIKIINSTHFAFMLHDFAEGNETSYYTSGGGRCTLDGNKYIEHLEYCSYRAYENIKVEFIATIQNDTLTLEGSEKVDSLDVNQTIIEKYIRLK